jgi:2,3-dihydroxy-p-cumate/2,3-dihydroxybenzoate 3,4-dioxygenase
VTGGNAAGNRHPATLSQGSREETPDMALIQEMGYAAYGVRDLGRAVEFFRNVCQLEVTERAGDVVFLSGDARHHWVRLEQRADPGLIRLGYRAADAAAVDEVAGRLDRLGVPHRRADDFARDRVTGALRFRAPDGIEYEIYEQMLTLPASPAPDRGIRCLLHAVIFVPDVAAARAFYTGALGMLVSDRIEEVITFLRCGNQYHHSLALARGEAGTLDHIAMLVGDIEDVLRFRQHGMIKDALAGDVVKHVASSSVSVYLHDPAEGIGVEYCNGHARITDESYSGRLIKAGPATVNAWSAGFPDRAPAGPQAAPAAGTGGGTPAAAAASAGTAAASAGMAAASAGPVPVAADA